MATITVTINTVASGPFNVLTLFTKPSTYGAAVTVSPANPLASPPPLSIIPPTQPTEITIQADPGNTAAHYVTIGDKNLAPTVAASLGIQLDKGLIWQRQGYAQALNELYVNASIAAVKMCIEVSGGFQ